MVILISRTVDHISKVAMMLDELLFDERRVPGSGSYHHMLGVIFPHLLIELGP